jgi:hypothetical protein
MLYDYSRIILSSPNSKENIIFLKNSGYTICVIEFVPKKKLQKFKKLIEIFYQSLCNKISVHFFVYTEKNLNILEGLNNYFKPENRKFGKGSFYCGIEVDKYDEFPWFRKSNKDVKFAHQLSFKFYNPNNVLGSHGNKGYFKSTLYIVCGPDYSGWEIELASFKDTIKYLKDTGLTIISCTEKASELYTNVDMKSPCCIVMGNEEEGIEVATLLLTDT